MATNIKYKPLTSLDMQKVVKLHRIVIPLEQLRRTIFYSPKVVNYLKSLVFYPDFQQDNYFLGAWHDDRLVGYAHYRVLGDTLHLNQIAVHPKYQGRGIGHQLAEQWKYKACELNMVRVSLDVDANNLRAYNWYQKMGLRFISKNYIYEREMPPQSLKVIPTKFHFLEWENTAAWQKAYGFSKISVLYENKVWKIGWTHDALHIGEHLPEVLILDLIRLLRNIRWLFLRSADHELLEMPISQDDWKLSSVIIRMGALLAEVR